MEDKILYLLMHVIINNTSTKKLIREGFSYLEIAKTMSFALENDYIQYVEDSIALTEKGQEKYISLEINYKKANKADWIEKDLKNKIQAIDKNVIFVPNVTELNLVTKYSELNAEKLLGNDISGEIHSE